jgi:hypothetical protein
MNPPSVTDKQIKRKRPGLHTRCAVVAAFYFGSLLALRGGEGLPGETYFGLAFFANVITLALLIWAGAALGDEA